MGWNFKKPAVKFKINTTEFVKNGFLTHTVNVGIESAFSKCPASAFSEGPGPGLSLLYKVCHVVELNNKITDCFFSTFKLATMSVPLLGANIMKNIFSEIIGLEALFLLF